MGKGFFYTEEPTLSRTLRFCMCWVKFTVMVMIYGLLCKCCGWAGELERKIIHLSELYPDKGPIHEIKEYLKHRANMKRGVNIE